jgi:hypothetical protein
LRRTVSPALVQPRRTLPPEAAQALFLADDSASMTEIAGIPEGPRASRWQVVQHVISAGLERLGPDVLVGAVSVGGRVEGHR